MPPLSDSTLAYDVQHGVAAARSLLWLIFDNQYEEIDGQPVPSGVVLIDYHFKDGTENKKNMVRDTIHKDRKPAGADFVTWEECANVRFREVEIDFAKYRITFEAEAGKPTGYWTKIGRSAEMYLAPETTMMLQALPETFASTSELEEHRGYILHEFGHALGLGHEHQSPSMEVKLNEKAVIDYYYVKEMSQVPAEDWKDAQIQKEAMDRAKKRAEGNILRRVSNPTNYTWFDTKSIMLYGIKKEWQQKPSWWKRDKREEIRPNYKLSELDQAFIRFMYPPDLSEPNNVREFTHAMAIAGIPTETAGRALAAFNQAEGTVAKKLTAVRDAFDLSLEGFPLSNRPANPALPRSINPIALSRSGVTEFVGEVTKNKLFQAIVKNLVYRTVVQNGLPTKISLPGSAQSEVIKILAALAMHDDVGHSIKYYDDQLRTKSDIRSSSSDSDPRDGTPEGTS